MWHNPQMRPEERASLTGFLAFAAALATTGAALVVMSATIDVHTDIAACLDVYTVPLAALKPEPLERALFVSGLFLFPGCLLLFASLLHPGAGRASVRPSAWQASLSPRVLWGAGTVAVFAWSLFVLAVNGSFYLRHSIGLDRGGLLALGAAAALTGVVFRRLVIGGGDPDAAADRLFVALLRALCLTLIGAVAAASIFGLGAVTNAPDYIVSFNAVFHAMVQVFQGRALLVNLNHQYGLYPHFLEPLFRIIGLSVLSYTIVMAALNAASLLLLYRFLVEIAENRIVRHLGCAALISGSLLYGAPPRPNAYFQYFPVRFFFPALVVFLLHRALQRRTAGWYVASLAAASLAVLWNLDTGLVVFAAWTATMAFDACCAREFRKALLHVLRACAALALTYALFAVYLFLRYGSWPNLAQQFCYQDLFYLCGFMMEPMPLAHPWTVVLLVCAAGLVRPVMALVTGTGSLRISMSFFLSVAGAGLFSYYQGRSVDSNLLFYPAILITVLFVDTLSRRVNKPGAGSDKLLLAGILLVWSVSIAGLGRNLPGLYAGTQERLSATFANGETRVTRSIAMLKRHLAPGQRVLMISGLSGIFYLETDTRSPLMLPSTLELVLTQDYLALATYLSLPETSVVVIDSTNSDNALNAAVYENFRIKEYNRDLLLSVLVKE